MTPEARAKLEELAIEATPEPWHIGHVNEDTGGVDIDDLDGRTIFHVHEGRDQAYICSVNPGAILWILNALDEAEESLNWIVNESSSWEPESDMCVRARAALAKIRGEK